jgi:hypothetical protein
LSLENKYEARISPPGEAGWLSPGRILFELKMIWDEDGVVGLPAIGNSNPPCLNCERQAGFNSPF